MNKCHICGSNDIKTELVKETFEIEGRLLIIENIPAQVCQRCGEVTFSSEIAENIRLIATGNKKPTKTLPVEVFAFSS